MRIFSSTELYKIVNAQVRCISHWTDTISCEDIVETYEAMSEEEQKMFDISIESMASEFTEDFHARFSPTESIVERLD